MQQPAFWVAVGKIIWINVLLSGDNALVIALACRGLAPRQRLWGMIFGAGAAVILRIIFTGIVASLMELPYLKLVGGLALIVIAAKLLVPEEADEDSVKSASHLWAAIQIVVVADIVMSLDNVIAVAAAANGSVPLLVLGLAISIPLIVAGAALIMALLTRLPILRSEEHTSELQSLAYLVCRLLLEKKKQIHYTSHVLKKKKKKNK